MNPTMVMLIGPTGCGKSTFRKNNLAKLPCVSPDDFVVGRWSPKKAAHAWQHARNMAIELLSERQTFVADAQFLDPSLRHEWQALARGFGFDRVGVAFNTSWRQLRRNQKARGARGLYGEIPLEVQKDAYQKMKDQLDTDYHNMVLRSGFDALHIVKFNEKIKFDI